MTDPRDDVEDLSLDQAATLLVEECRMVLPGVQALFGFQLAVVFTDRFEKVLDARERLLHLGSIALVALAIALVMTPAAYHRMTDPRRASAHFIRVSTRLLMLGMPVLMVALALDAYLVGRAVTHDTALSAGLGAALVVVFGALWFGLPWVNRRRGRVPARPRR